MPQNTLKKIAHVDDEEDIRFLTELALTETGEIEVRQWESGPDILENIGDFSPDLFLLDMMMPKMDGLMIMKALSEMDRFRKTPVIFMTAKVQPSDVDGMLEKGALAVIEKPFDPMSLASEIQSIWQAHIEKQEN